MRRAWLGSAVAILSVAQAQSDDTRLVAAMQSRDVATVRTLLAEGVGVNTTDAETATALHWAAHWNDTEAVRLLLDAGADPNARNRFDVTPLHEAALQLNSEMVQALLEAGADPNAAFGDGETVVMTAARTGHAGVLGLLLEHGGDISAAEGWHGQTALMWAAQENHADAARLLIEHGASVNRRSTAHDWVEIEYSAGNVPKTRDVGGLTPLHFAARHGSTEVAAVLLAAGADLTATEPMYELTPLQTAIVNGHYTLAMRLIEQGADVDDGSLYLAVDTRNLGYYAQRPNPPQKDGEFTSLDVIVALLKQGADAELVYEKGIPERTVAGQIEAPRGAIPLDRAAVATDAAAIRALVEYGADPNATAADGATALLLLSGLSRGRAVTALDESPERLEAIQTLLNAGANPDIQEPKTGNTAFHYAAGLKAREVASMLNRYGANGNIRNAEGQSVWDLMDGSDFISGASPDTR